MKKDKLIQETLRATLMHLCHGGSLAISPELTYHTPRTVCTANTEHSKQQQLGRFL